MKKFISILIFTLLLGVNIFAHETFTQVSSQKKTVKEAELASLENAQTKGKKDKTVLTFTEKEIRLVATTGPEDDMLSYRIQGVRNPTIVIPSGANLTVLFINTDGDMKHDIRFGQVAGDLAVMPEMAETAGTSRLEHKTEGGMLNAEEVVIKPTTDGAYKYFCSVRGHGKGGMWGNILVGVKPDASMKMSEKSDMSKMDEMPGMKMDDKKKSEDMSDMPGMKKDAKKSNEMSAMPGMNNANMEMRSTVNLAEPMSRESSGTSWMPDSTPTYAYMKMYENGDMLMLHGNMFFRYTNVGSSRDLSVAGKGNEERFDAPSMFMAMYSHPISKKSQIGFRVMLSLDPITERGYGYPLLYQSGETYKNQLIHDRQHPHDFFSELSATYSYKFNNKQSMYFYAGYPGEPALGPPAFMHRLSAMNIPDAPISHHWQDSTHITFGVLTGGYVYDKVKFEVSAFNGSEPNENRWNFDKPRFNSFSGRLSWNPTKDLAFQVSYGYLKNPEPLSFYIYCYKLPYVVAIQPQSCRIERRITASAIYNKNFGNDRNWANSLIWGQKTDTDYKHDNAFLYETDYQFQKNSIFSRLEWVQKNSHELALANPHPPGIFGVGAYSVGYVRDLVRDKGMDVGLGGLVTLNTNPPEFSRYYGGTKHGGFQIFFRIRPSRINH